MRIIGIDPGTGILGFGVVDVEHGKTRLGTEAHCTRTTVIWHRKLK
jgi:Holliday junction resolvasome RuvABC endonuclease subunit